MITFRKHAVASTACHISALGRLPGREPTGTCITASIILLFIMSATALATPQRGKHIGKHKEAQPSTQSQGEETNPETKPEAKVPISVNPIDTPDRPGILAIIGAFPSDLVDEAGQAYLERDFFEHVVAALLLLDDSPDSETYPMIEVAMLPQEKNQREGDFIFGKVNGHIIVVVEKRRVIVKCTFREPQRTSSCSRASL